jgi:chromosomal replication initiation ATPase DnaA
MDRETQRLQAQIKSLKEDLREQRYQNTYLQKQINAAREGRNCPSFPNYKQTVVARLRNIIEIMYDVDISKKTRKGEVVLARHIFHHYLCYNTSYSLKVIGNLLELKLDHSTVIHSKKTINDLLDTDKALRIDYAEIVRKMSIDNIISEEEIVINPS